jgi:hypothetical protein
MQTKTQNPAPKKKRLSKKNGPERLCGCRGGTRLYRPNRTLCVAGDLGGKRKRKRKRMVAHGSAWVGRKLDARASGGASEGC